MTSNQAPASGPTTGDNNPPKGPDTEGSRKSQNDTTTPGSAAEHARNVFSNMARKRKMKQQESSDGSKSFDPFGAVCFYHNISVAIHPHRLSLG